MVCVCVCVCACACVCVFARAHAHTLPVDLDIVSLLFPSVITSCLFTDSLLYNVLLLHVMHYGLKEPVSYLYCCAGSLLVFVLFLTTTTTKGLVFRLLFRTTKQELKSMRKMIECNRIRWKLFDLRTVSGKDESP